MQIVERARSNIFSSPNIYRLITAASFIFFVIMVMAIPARMSGASPWAYYYAVKNFSQGKLIISDRELMSDAYDAMQQGGILMQYVKVGDNRWAVEKAPGYIFYMVPFYKLGIPRWGNIVLAAGMIAVLYLLLKRIRDELAACLGSLLILFTPMALIMANRAYMDTYASLAFAAMGGGLYFYYLLQKDAWRSIKQGVVIFFAFLLIGWSVVVRESNLLIAIVLALHYLVMRFRSLRNQEKAWLRIELPAVVLGAGLTAAVMLIYNNIVFGAPLSYGYQYSLFPVKFAFQYLGQTDAAGHSIPLDIIMNNVKVLPLPLLEGFPVLVLFIPTIIFLTAWKIIYGKKPSIGRWAGLEREISRGTLVTMAGIFLSVFALYYMYEFTATSLKEGATFFRYSRYYLPGLFPMAVICAPVLARLPKAFIIPIMSLIVTTGIVFYLQTALDINA